MCFHSIKKCVIVIFIICKGNITYIICMNYVYNNNKYTNTIIEVILIYVSDNIYYLI